MDDLFLVFMVAVGVCFSIGSLTALVLPDRY